MSSIGLKAVEDVVNDEEFWSGIRANMANRMGPIAQEVTIAGAEAAEAAGAIVDMDAINRQALQATRTIETAWWRSLEDTTRLGLRESLVTWQQVGLGKRGLPDLIRSVEKLFDKKRARRIAVTETTRMFAEGNKMAADADPEVGGLQWITAEDELVCAICGPEGPTRPNGRQDKIYPKGAVPDCPAHVYCRCDLVPVSWRYIQNHPELWQGGPLTEAPTPEAGGVKVSEDAGDVSREEIEEWQGMRRQAANAARAGRQRLRNPTPGLHMRDNGELVGITNYLVPPKKGYIFVDYMATKRSGYGRSMMQQICRQAALRKRGVQLQSTVGSAGFYGRLGMSPIESALGYGRYRFTTAEAARFAELG